jgi:hypothetical protein
MRLPRGQPIWHLQGPQGLTNSDGPTQAAEQLALHRHLGLTSHVLHQEPPLFQRCGHSLLTQQEPRSRLMMAAKPTLTFYDGTGTTLEPLQQLHSSQHSVITLTRRRVQVHNLVPSQVLLSSTDKALIQAAPRT